MMRSLKNNVNSFTHKLRHRNLKSLTKNWLSNGKEKNDDAENQQLKARKTVFERDFGSDNGKLGI